jgi:riboflavin synthase
MFTGIVTALGEVAALERRSGLVRAEIDSIYDPASVAIGASISHDGCCLTVVEIAARGGGMRHVVEIAAESLAKTTLGNWRVGDRVNLERSLRAGDELGGHIVQGHVDGVGEILAANDDVAPKGAISVHGVSLTVNEADDVAFGVLIIPHTRVVTTLGKLARGDKVNLEADMMARYLARLIAARSS